MPAHIGINSILMTWSEKEREGVDSAPECRYMSTGADTGFQKGGGGGGVRVTVKY